jgi:hypothetical protein
MGGSASSWKFPEVAWRHDHRVRETFSLGEVGRYTFRLQRNEATSRGRCEAKVCNAAKAGKGGAMENAVVPSS